MSFTETAPYRFCNSVDLAITSEQLFEVLADAEAWPHWASTITKVTWTTPEPRGVGATRIVNLRGGTVGDEEFLVWEPFTRMAFRFNECSARAVAAFAADYRVEVIPGGCRMTWTLAQKPAGPAKLAMFVARPLLNVGFRRFLTNPAATPINGSPGAGRRRPSGQRLLEAAAPRGGQDGRPRGAIRR